MSPDRNLLFGILALQNDFVTRDQLVEAMNAWVLARHRPLGDLLRERGALGEVEFSLLEAIVAHQLARHQGDVEKSLHAIELSSSARAALAAVPDADVQAILACLGTPSSDATSEHVKRPGAEGMRYRVLRAHARGGLGEVFVAEDTELHREVALKEIQLEHADNPDSRGRFLLEAEITGRLEHPGIVPVYGLGHYEDGRPFYAMRFIKGDNLHHALQRFHASKEGFDTVAFRRVLRRFLDVCNAVAYAHARGVLHRDLKPGNVMLGKFGETLLVDWGLAKVLGARSVSDGLESDEPTLRPSSGNNVVETVAGRAIGTPAYMSPEQAEGKLDALGPATDVYSLGATLYCLLTGRAPVSEGALANMLEKVRRGDFAPADQVRAGVPKALAAVCGKAMALLPGERYPSPLALAQDVEHWLADEPISAYRDPLLARVGRWARKNRTLVTTAASVLLVALVGLSLGLVVVGGLNRRLETANAGLDAALADAEDKRSEAEKERNIAVAVNEFLRTDLLGQADIGNQPFLGEKEGRDPHITVAELLDRAAKAIEGRFQDQPETEAAIRLTIGDTYHALGKYELAQGHLERSLAVREKEKGADHPDTLSSKHSLAVLYRYQAKYDKAEPLLLEVLKQKEKKLGAEHPDTLTSKHSLAELYRYQGKYDKADSLHLEVLQQREKILGADHLNTLVSKHNVALLYERQGKYTKAEPLLLEVLQQHEKKLGADHPHTLVSKYNLAALYRYQAKYDKAEPLFLEVLKQKEKKLGADHPHTMTSKSSLATLYRFQGKYDKAEPLFLEVLKQQENKLGADHPHSMATKTNLASLYRDQGKNEKAEPLHLEVLKQQEKRLGADHPHTLTTKNNLALLYLDQRKYDKAEPLLLEVLQQREKKLGADHPNTLTSKHNLAALYRIQRKYDKAEPLFLEVLKQKEKKRGADHPETLSTMNSLAVLYLEQRKFDKAETLFLDVLKQMEKKLGADHPNTLNPRNSLASLYSDQGKYDKAEPLLLDVLKQREKKLGAEHPDTTGTMATLGSNLLQQKKYAQAEKLLRDCLRVREKAQPDVWSTPNTRSLLGEALLGQKKYADAEPLLVQGYEGMEKRAAKMPPEIRPVRLKEALERLVQLYDATGNKDEAARWRMKLDEATKAAAKEPAKK